MITSHPAPLATGSTRRRVQGIDLLRGIAIALVMLRHALPEPFAGAGVVGVVMFFTLSGYLISGVLLGELAARGRVDFRRFYVNRAVRLVPALVVMIIAFVIVTITLDPLGDRDDLVRTVLVALTYTGDLPFHHGSAATFHLWTLATEEQFYLVWPTVLALAWVRGRVGLMLAGALIISAAACVATIWWLDPYPDLAYQLPTAWAGCFVVGAAARVHVDRHRVPPRPRPRVTKTAVVGALAGLAAMSVLPLRGHVWTYLVAAPMIAALTAVLLISWRSWYVVGARLLQPWVALGTISYGAYLWNYPLILWLRPFVGDAAGAIGSVLTILVAALSWRLVEAPLQRRGRLHMSTREPQRDRPDPSVPSGGRRARQE